MLWERVPAVGVQEVPVHEFGPRQDPRRRDLTDTVQHVLASRGIVELERDAVIGGHLVDLLFTSLDGNTAVLVDTGPHPAVTRHDTSA